MIDGRSLANWAAGRAALYAAIVFGLGLFFGAGCAFGFWWVTS